MITFQVIDLSPSYYPRQSSPTISISDDFKIEKWHGGLKIISNGNVHKFDKDGCYIGTHPVGKD